MPPTLMDSFSGYLLTYINTTKKRDANYEIAVQMLKHYNCLADMTLDQIAELCFVSQASVSRFCKLMGYSTFAEFKEALRPSHRSAFKVSRCYPRDLPSFLARLSDPQSEYLRTLQTNLEQVASPSNLAQIDRLLPALHDAKRVVCFGSHFNWDCSTFLQKRLILLNRFVEGPYHGDDQLETAHTLSSQDLAILVTANCTYRAHYGDCWEALMNSSAKVALITQNTQSILVNDADFVLSCGVSNQFDNAKLSTLQLMDLLVMKYIQAYGESY